MDRLWQVEDIIQLHSPDEWIGLGCEFILTQPLLHHAWEPKVAVGVSLAETDKRIAKHTGIEEAELPEDVERRVRHRRSSQEQTLGLRLLHRELREPLARLPVRAFDAMAFVQHDGIPLDFTDGLAHFTTPDAVVVDDGTQTTTTASHGLTTQPLRPHLAVTADNQHRVKRTSIEREQRRDGLACPHVLRQHRRMFLRSPTSGIKLRLPRLDAPAFKETDLLDPRGANCNRTDDEDVHRSTSSVVSSSCRISSRSASSIACDLPIRTAMLAAASRLAAV